MAERSVPRVWSRVAVMAAVLVALFGSGAVAASASTASVKAGPPVAHSVPSADGAAASRAAAGPFHMTTPYGTLTYGWRPLTGMSTKAVPDSASGCSQDVCIQIVGHSNYVNDWNTQGYWNGPYICTYSIFEANDIVIRTGTVVCGGAGVFYTNWPANRYFPSPTQGMQPVVEHPWSAV